MDYLELYNYFYNKAHIITKRFVIAEMKTEKLKNRPSLTVHNKISAYIYNRKEKNYTIPLKNNFWEPYDLFQKRHSYYQGEHDYIIKSILEDEVLKAFKKEHTTSYSTLIANLAIGASLNDAYNHYVNYRNYYELIYLQDSYQYFYFEYFIGVSVENSSEYSEMMDVEYPNRILEREILEKENKINEVTTIKKPEEKSISKLQNNFGTLELLKSFNDDERFLLINIIYKLINDEIKNSDQKSSKLLATDFMKLMRIAGSYDDLSIFVQEAKMNTSYSKVSRGVHYYTGKGQLDIIDSTLDKLQPFNVKILLEELLRIKRKHLANQR